MSDMAESKNRRRFPTRAGNRARSVRASAVRVSRRAHSLDFALGQPELRLLGAGAHDARGTTGLPDGDLERRGVSNSWHRVSLGTWSECRSAKHAPGHLATVGLAQRPLEPEAGRRGDGKRHCRFCVHARATRMRVLRARACGIDARDDKVSRRRSGRLSMNRSHFRTVAMKRKISVSKYRVFGFRHARVNLRQTSRPGGRDTSVAGSGLERLRRTFGCEKKKKSRRAIRCAPRRGSYDFVTVLLQARARPSEGAHRVASRSATPPARATRSSSHRHARG